MGEPALKDEPVGVVRMTRAEYLRFENEAETRHELEDGVVIDMAGGSLEHSRLGANVITALGNAVRGGPCAVYSNDLRVAVPRKLRYRYPDATVVCGEAAVVPDDEHTITNPTLVVEVLSPSTERRDRGVKAEDYRSIPTLQQYVLVAQDRAYVERYTRSAEGDWLLRTFFGLDAVVPLDAIGARLALSDVYAGVTLLPDADNDA